MRQIIQIIYQISFWFKLLLQTKVLNGHLESDSVPNLRYGLGWGLNLKYRLRTAVSQIKSRLLRINSVPNLVWGVNFISNTQTTYFSSVPNLVYNVGWGLKLKYKLGTAVSQVKPGLLRINSVPNSDLHYKLYKLASNPHITSVSSFCFSSFLLTRLYIVCIYLPLKGENIHTISVLGVANLKLGTGIRSKNNSKASICQEDTQSYSTNRNHQAEDKNFLLVAGERNDKQDPALRSSISDLEIHEKFFCSRNFKSFSYSTELNRCNSIKTLKLSALSVRKFSLVENQTIPMALGISSGYRKNTKYCEAHLSFFGTLSHPMIFFNQERTKGYFQHQ